MKLEVPLFDAKSGNNFRQALVWAMLAGLVCLAAISSQSFWIDEALTGVKAAQPDLTGWWRIMVTEKASDLQMPLYMGYIWVYARMFGVSEWALRAANLPGFIIGFAALLSVVPSPKKIWLAALVLISPFAWYYLDEARPYAWQFSASLLILAALIRLNQENGPDNSSRWWLLLAGLILLSGSSLLGMIWAGAACLSLLVLFSINQLKQQLHRHKAVFLLGILSFTLLGIYYLWSIKLGARASDAGRTDARNVGFIIYELCGLSGLGPGRLEIRANGLASFRPYLFPVGIALALVAFLLVTGAINLRRSLSAKRFWGLMAVLALPCAALVAAGVIMHFRILGRHFTPLAAVLLLVVWRSISGSNAQRNKFLTAILALYIGMMAVSALSLRLAGRHKKDDYRDAAQAALAAQKVGQTIWWNAGLEGANYYHLRLYSKKSPTGRAIFLMNPGTNDLSVLPPPDLIITSKPDIFDGNGAVTAYLHERQYHETASFPAFSAWRR